MPSRRAATIVDIARAAGVSRTTASAALGGAGRVSDATREHVRKVAEELGYVANATARHLQAGRKGAIGIYITDVHFGFGFYMDFVFGAAACCRQDAFALTLISGSGGDNGRPPIGHVDGVILVDPVAGDPMVQAIVASGIPVVSAERYLDAGPQPLVTVETEYRQAERDLLDHLWDRGARAPALLTIPIEFSWKRLMEQTYRGWCQEHGVTPTVRVLELTDTDAVRVQARELLAEIHGVDAILAGADGTALGVLGAARDVGRHVGVDLLVASNVDSIAMQLASPPVTAIETRPREIGRDAAHVLLAVLRGDEVPDSIRRPQPTIAIRESTAALSPRAAADRLSPR